MNQHLSKDLPRSSDPEPRCSDAPAGARRLQRRFTWLLAIWALVFLSSTYLIVQDLALQPPLQWGVALLPSVLALAAVLAYWRYLRQADELARMIELHALAYAVSAGFVVWPAIQLLGQAGVPVDAGPSLPVLVMVGFYSLGVVLARSRYR